MKFVLYLLIGVKDLEDSSTCSKIPTIDQIQ